MDEDDLIIIYAFVIYWIILLILTFLSKQKKRVFLINFMLHVLYSSYFIYELYYKPQGWKNSLNLWALLLSFIGIHWVLNLIHLVILIIKKIIVAKNRKAK